MAERISCLLAILLLLPGTTLADGRDFGFCGDAFQRGWNYYCDPSRQKKPAPPPAAPETSSPAETKSPPVVTPEPQYPATAAIEAARKDLDELKNRAILAPTHENLQAYMYAQKAMVDQAGQFADVWQRVLYKTPDLDANRDYPLSQMGGQVYQDQKRVAWEHSLQLAAANLGFMVVVSDEQACQLCARQLEVIKGMETNYGIVPMVISKDGSWHRLYPRASVDTGQLKKLGLDGHPTPFIALVEPKTGAVEPLGSGLLTEDVILERVFVITQIPAGDRYKGSAP